MSNIIHIAAERQKRMRRITTASRIAPSLKRAVQRQLPKKGDRVETTLGIAYALTDELLMTCRGQKFYLLPSHIAKPEDGIA